MSGFTLEMAKEKACYRYIILSWLKKVYMDYLREQMLYALKILQPLLHLRPARWWWWFVREVGKHYHYTS